MAPTDLGQSAMNALLSMEEWRPVPDQPDQNIIDFTDYVDKVMRYITMAEGDMADVKNGTFYP